MTVEEAVAGVIVLGALIAFAFWLLDLRDKHR